MPYPAEILLARLRTVCQQEARLVAAMQYGSLARGQGDAYSDLDILLYFDADTLPTLDKRAWLEQVGPLELLYTNEFGIDVVIFREGLVRAEFHFDPAAAIARWESFRGVVAFPDLASALLLDRTGELSAQLRPLVGPPPAHAAPEDAAYLAHSLLNWLLMGANLVARGEYARAHEVLNLGRGHLLRLARQVEGAPAQWVAPARWAERELSPQAYARLVEVTPGLAPAALRAAYRAAFAWGRELAFELAQRRGVVLDPGLFARIEAHIVQLTAGD